MLSDRKINTLLNFYNRVREGQMTDENEATLKTRVTTLDYPNHFNDALRVYGTNEQTDEYNSTMLQKLNTSKYTIKSSDITKDRDTRQVNLSLEGKKRAQTGGLTSNLTDTENAFIRLTSNIDVTDGLANGVRGIIQKLITNHKGSVSVILVKFDDETVGEKAKMLSQYKEQYPDAVPIFRHGKPFQHKNVTIFRSQFPLILAWASTIHSVQGLTVDKIVVDLSKLFAAGQVYVALSRVTTSQGLQILNYKTSAIRKDKIVQKEMIRLQSKAITFNWPVVLTLQHKQWIKICHLNVRGYLNHITDIKIDPNICFADIMCFTETHLRNSDVIHINSQPTKHPVSFRKDRLMGDDKGGVMMFVHPQISASSLNINIPQLEFTGAITSPVPNKQLVIITV